MYAIHLSYRQEIAMKYQPVLRKRLHEEVAQRVEAMIRDGEFAEGQYLPSEKELREMFGVGRPAVREALLTLQQRGLLVTSNGERARVTKPDTDKLLNTLSGAAGIYLSNDMGVRHFQACRKIFEGGVVREVARTATPIDIERIGRSLADNGRARGNILHFAATDVNFHLEIVRTLSNPMLDGVHRALAGWLTDQRRVSLAEDDAERSAYEFHQRIFAAIEAHDPNAAEREMHAHLDAVANFYWNRKDSSR
jgi:DNA-binding FadR family transcriptional regulator